MTESLTWQTIDSPDDPPIIDRFGNKWTLGRNRRLFVNGQMDRGAAYVQKATYVNRMIWIYVGQWWFKDALTDPWSLADGPPVDHSNPGPTTPDPRIDTLIGLVNTLITEIKTMSGTISDQIDAMTVKFQADVDSITTEIGDLHTQITTLTGQLVPGATLTQAQVDALGAIEAKAAALATPVVVTPPAPPAP